MSTLFLALSVPDADPEVDDPDEIADRMVSLINERWRPKSGDVMVAGIPAPQWLTPETLANLRSAAAGPS